MMKKILFCCLALFSILSMQAQQFQLQKITSTYYDGNTPCEENLLFSYATTGELQQVTMSYAEDGEEPEDAVQLSYRYSASEIQQEMTLDDFPFPLSSTLTLDGNRVVNMTSSFGGAAVDFTYNDDNQLIGTSCVQDDESVFTSRLTWSDGNLMRIDYAIDGEPAGYSTYTYTTLTGNEPLLPLLPGLDLTSDDSGIISPLLLPFGYYGAVSKNLPATIYQVKAWDEDYAVGDETVISYETDEAGRVVAMDITNLNIPERATCSWAVASGISQPQTTSARDTQTYDLSGRPTTRAHKGIAIVRPANGHARKIIRK